LENSQKERKLILESLNILYVNTLKEATVRVFGNEDDISFDDLRWAEVIQYLDQNLKKRVKIPKLPDVLKTMRSMGMI